MYIDDLVKSILKAPDISRDFAFESISILSERAEIVKNGLFELDATRAMQKVNPEIELLFLLTQNDRLIPLTHSNSEAESLAKVLLAFESTRYYLEPLGKKLSGMTEVHGKMIPNLKIVSKIRISCISKISTIQTKTPLSFRSHVFFSTCHFMD